jgi:hypothetical protein
MPKRLVARLKLLVKIIATCASSLISPTCTVLMAPVSLDKQAPVELLVLSTLRRLDAERRNSATSVTVDY